MQLPNVFAYDDYRLYLQNWLQAKQQGGNLSRRWFAKHAGFKSHNILALILTGKRNLGIKSIPKFTAGLGLIDEEARYFETLVLMNQADTVKERIHYFERLTAFAGRRKAVPMERGRLGFFTNWLAPVIYEMAQFRDFQPDANWIAAQFRPELPLAEVKRVMADLLSMGLVTVAKNGKWICHEEILDSGDNVKDVHLFAYHEQALAKASDALQDVPAAQRYFRVLTSAAPREALEELRLIAQKFEAEVWKCLAQHPEAKAEIWQIGLQIFPILQRPAQPQRKMSTEKKK
jgi:uncharacterized protein (TIGR02147 family)